MEALLALLLLLASVQRSASVQCFAYFDLDSGECDAELGEVDQDDCCQNPQYGYQEADGSCQSCGPPAWSPWSTWSPCNVLCGEGVRQRHRGHYGFGRSEKEDSNLKDRLQTEPCNGICCDDKGWSPWQAWSPCSVTCGGVGVKKRQRLCSSPPECSMACSGPKEETERCEHPSACPVHGGWAAWSDWSQCSGTCIADQLFDVPLRTRQRSCSSPAPSTDTAPPGNSCPGDAVETQACSELPDCPVDGNWGPWAPPGPCSVPCGEGLQLSVRRCDSPAPQHGGKYCEGQSSRSVVCQSPCPVHGFWSGWSPWSECSATCIPEGKAAFRTRQRLCNNPAPSSAPPGRPCQGDDKERENCQDLPHCPVDGSWGSWSQFSPCPVKCGVGLRESVRTCNSPTPKHGGLPCPGEGRKTAICLTNVHCPVHGVWSEWSRWSDCKYPWGKKDIRCQEIGGSQKRTRTCLYRAHNGTFCAANSLTDSQVCYDVNKCLIKGNWEAWGAWSFCDPPCGANSSRVRNFICEPDYSKYRPTIGRQQEPATFFGTPRARCQGLPEGGERSQTQPCVNVPPCT
ncbi:properdin-like [Cololabis saira]|uniref:properdin-like n=1 Tax=Cololabis saira TaxID=129043 RepID=UPI002AD496CD|nr:properdin-like [Cololabis saira]